MTESGEFPKIVKQPRKNRRCEVVGCGDPHSGLGFCSKHYQRYKIYGDPVHPPQKLKKICLVEDCGRPRYAKEFCQKHWRRFDKYGDPLVVMGRSRKQQSIRSCTVPGCSDEHRSMGFCDRHYKKRASLSHKLNMSWDNYLILGDKQGWRCYGCQIQSSVVDTNVLHVDHDHQTMEVRGLLCGSCNRALGLLKDDKETLIRLATYLERG